MLEYFVIIPRLRFS